MAGEGGGLNREEGGGGGGGVINFTYLKREAYYIGEAL